MSNLWTPVREKYGIAIHNYLEEEAWRIKLTVGECIHILEENGQWYFGFTAKNRGLRGIFPKCYVKIMDSFVDDSGPSEVTCLKQPQIVQEITSVLREWGILWKHLYINKDKNFRKMEQRMYELMSYRSQILSGTLPVDELKQVKRLVTSKIDMGNKVLGLDMVVRDEHGNILNPEQTSTIQLFKHHEIATERIRKATATESDSVSKKTPKPGSQQLTHTLFVSVRNFVCKMADDAELLMTLYDGKEQKAFTENYVVRWSKEGLAREIDQIHNLRALFTDLGSRDLNREKVYLVCYVVRIGGMEVKEPDKESKKNSRQSISKPPPSTDVLRRPYGVAAIDITLFLIGKMETDEDKHHFLPFLLCEKDNLEGTLRRILANKELSQKDHKGQGLHCSFKMLHGDIKQVREENPHLVLGQVAIARKMGFPEVILMENVRNDLYLTLVSGEFSKGSKSTDKNVEITVKVCSEKGQPLQGVIMLGGGVPPQNEYKSVIYYHEDKPRWFETFKIAVPIEDFKGCHLRFTFKHRSSNETKDKNEKPFALSYVRLMQEDGTTLRDIQHDLLVYKVDHKKYDPNDLGYLNLPSKRSELIEGAKPTSGGLVLTNKDSFAIQTNVCSTKLTQNVDLLGLLNWTSQPDTLEESLKMLMNVDGEEIVKFLQDVLDALFNILMQNSDSEVYDNLVFECLLYIIGLVSDRKYQSFQHVLDSYIQDSFSATLAYNKLVVVLKHLVDGANSSEDKDLLLKTMKSLQYIMKFIVRSRLLFFKLYEGKGQQQFELSLKQLLQSIAVMMCYTTDGTLLVQGACLKYLPSTIPDILQVFSPTELSSLLMDLINKIPAQRLAKQKMMTVRDIVHSQLFLDSDCRAILLPAILVRIKELLEAQDEINEAQARSSVEYRNKSKSVAKLAKVLGATSLEKITNLNDLTEEVELCVKILSDIMDLLFVAPPGSTIRDITEVMLTVLRTVIQTTIALDRESPLVGGLVSVMISVFRQMTAHHFDVYIRHFPTPTDLLDFLMEILLVFKDLVSRPVYLNDWSEMIMLQNSVILKSLRHFSHTIRDFFFTKFEHQAWNNFFHCAIAFLTQPALQLDNFSATKRWRLVSRYKDMRRETGFEIRSMWFNLGQHKIQFVPSLVGSFLEMTLIPETELRRATIPIFFDMMQCEFYSPRDPSETKRDHIKANFNEFENEMIAKLDNLVEAGRGDEHYKDLFYEIMMNLCENHSTMKEQGVRFVKIVTRLMERLLEYRSIITDDNKENRMSCTVNLLDFYSEINRKEMYIRYVNKLCDLHLDADNFTEAGFTLRLHSKLLNWSDNLLPPLLRSHKYPLCQTHRQLKEALYLDMINYFDKGKMWECALAVCKELVKQFEEEIYDYYQLSELLRKMAVFYDSIMKQMRPNPEYFRVAYYGRGFPAFLQNKMFIYRGKEFERLSDFISRTLNQLPNAEFMKTLTPPSEDITESPHQFVQINHVEPVMDDRKKRLSGKPISDQILRYHQVNDVQKFRFSRPFHRVEEGLEENEFASLWLERTVLVTSYPLPGILRWFPVTAADTFQISPLRNGIETMETTNKELRQLIVAHRHDPALPINPLSMKLNGIVDAAVMGGINNYEKAFFSEDYLKRHPEDAALVQRLKDLIAQQIPLLEVGIRLHGERAPPSLVPLQQRLETCFYDMRAHVEAKYGKKTCDLKFEPVTLRRQVSTATTIGNESNRLSGTSFGSSEGSSSRVSGISVAQVVGLKSFVSFSSSGTLTRPTSLSSPSKKDKEKEKKRRAAGRRSSTKLSDRESTGSSQWYTSADITEVVNSIVSVNSALSPAKVETAAPVYELTQELTTTRPLRSEIEKEKRLSRPASGQFAYNNQRLTAVNGSSRDSIGTTDSTNSEEDNTPPPLPIKLREADYCNLPDDNSITSPASPLPPTPVRPKPPPPEPTDNTLPPTPPPKRPHIKPPLSMPLI